MTDSRGVRWRFVEYQDGEPMYEAWNKIRLSGKLSLVLAALVGAGAVGTDVFLFLDNVSGVGSLDDVFMSPANMVLLTSGAAIVNELIVKRRTVHGANRRSWSQCLRCYANDLSSGGKWSLVKHAWRLRLIKRMSLLGVLQVVFMADDAVGVVFDNFLQLPTVIAWLVLASQLFTRIVSYRWY